MGGAVRAVILQHFAEGGTAASWRPDYGDLALKESNQDKGGKLVGLALGLMLLRMIGARPARFRGETLALVCFAASRWCTSPETPPPSNNCACSRRQHRRRRRRRRRRRGAACSCHRAIPTACRPSTARTDCAPWHARCHRPRSSARCSRGHGSTASAILRTPEQAVRIDIFLQAVAAVTALAAGFPLFTRAFDYTQPRWKLLSALLAAAAGVLRFGASFVAHRPILSSRRPPPRRRWPPLPARRARR